MTLPTLLVELELLRKRAVKGPIRIVVDDAPDVPIHGRSGLCKLVANEPARWHYGRLMEWPEAELVSVLINNLDGLLSLARQQEGCVSVPVEPTSDMCAAGADCTLDTKTEIGMSTALKIYKAMLSAAPQAQSTKEPQ